MGTDSTPTGPRGLILYGSQQGNATEIAKMVHSDYLSTVHPLPNAPHIEFMSMLDYMQNDKELDDLPTHQLLICVVSTTGNGDPPDNASKFIRFLKRRKDKTWLQSVDVAILGLGDSNYDKFCGVAKLLHELLITRLGGQPIVDSGYADDGIGLELVVEPWRNSLMEKLKTHITQGAAAPNGTPAADHQPTPAEPPVSAEQNSNNTDSTPTQTPAPTQAEPTTSSATDYGSEDYHNTVIDSEKKTAATADIDVPKQLPRLSKCKLRIKFFKHNALANGHTHDDAVSYYKTRWQNLNDTETVLRGYTPETPCIATMQSARYLTTEASHIKQHTNASSSSSHVDAQRCVVHMQLKLPSAGHGRLQYSPGDSVGIYAGNDKREVQQLCKRLHVDEQQLIQITNESAGSIPSHFPASSCTLSQLLQFSCDITAVPKRVMLRVLAEYCTNGRDRETLYRYASRDNDSYLTDVLVNRPTLLELLETYRSCHPAISHLLELLPPLQPRYYSVCNSPLQHPTEIEFAYSLVRWQTPKTNIMRHGIATTWLTQAAVDQKLLTPVWNIQPNSSSASASVALFIRRTTEFSLPSELERPVIMIGPGTGVAPFRGFTQHRHVQLAALKSGGTSMGWWRGFEVEEEDEEPMQTHSPNKYVNDQRAKRKKAIDEHRCRVMSPVNSPLQTDVDVLHHTHINELSLNDKQEPTLKSVVEADPHDQHSHPPSTTDPSILYESIERQCTHTLVAPHKHAEDRPQSAGKMLLFFGCRGRELDYLYSDEWSRYVSDGTLSAVYTAFSRENAEQKVYVQDNLAFHGKQIAELVIKQNAMVYVCGDGASMAQDVQRTIVSVLSKCSGMTSSEAQKYVADMQHDKRYVTDLWS